MYTMNERHAVKERKKDKTTTQKQTNSMPFSLAITPVPLGSGRTKQTRTQRKTA